MNYFAIILALALCLGTSSASIRETGIPKVLDVPPGYEQYECADGVGQQIYSWDKSEWVLQEPFAVLFPQEKKKDKSRKADKKPIGIHYDGPAWQWNDGRKIEAQGIIAQVTVDENAVNWLLVEALNDAGKTEYIQRLETQGGLAPDSKDQKRDIILVPYSALYCFYRMSDEKK